MNKNSIIDYLGCILFKGLGHILRKLPLSYVLFFGRRLGDLLYYLDPRHRAIAYANIKFALGSKLSPKQLSALTKRAYRTFGQNFIEIFLIPLIDKQYVEKYLSNEGLNFLQEGLDKNKGVILLAIHSGNWELGNSWCSAWGFPYLMFVRGQRYPRLNNLLNSYRMRKGMQVINREEGLRSLIQALKDNKIVAMTVDQGGKHGMGVKFFGKDASMASGAVKLALKYNAALVLGFSTRINGPRIKVFFQLYPDLIRSGDLEKDVHDNLQAIINKYEKLILQYPQEYFWNYRIWKYSKEKSILILSDGRTGHLRQSQALAGIIARHLEDKGIKTTIDTLEVAFKNKFPLAVSCFGAKFQCQGCSRCLEAFLRPDIYQALTALNPDIVVSAGSSVAGVNYVVSRQNMAKSFCIMRPAFLSTNKFDLVVMPQHDRPAPRKNIAVTRGALNLIDEEYLKQQAQKLSKALGAGFKVQGSCIGLLIGGDAKDFHLQNEMIDEVIRQVKSVSRELKADILLTTSRRTSLEIDRLIKEELQGEPGCKLCLIANEKNIPEAVGGILGLSEIIIVSAESISMISEAASSKKYVLVFGAEAVKGKHRRFLDTLADKKYIYIVKEKDLAVTIKRILLDRPEIRVLNDRLEVAQAIKKVL